MKETKNGKKYKIIIMILCIIILLLISFYIYGYSKFKETGQIESNNLIGVFKYYLNYYGTQDNNYTIAIKCYKKSQGTYHGYIYIFDKKDMLIETKCIHYFPSGTEEIANTYYKACLPSNTHANITDFYFDNKILVYDANEAPSISINEMFKSLDPIITDDNFFIVIK